MSLSSLLQRIILVSLLLIPKLAGAEILESMNSYERGLAFLLDKGIASSGYAFKDTDLIPEDHPDLISSPLSIGQALVLNERLSRGVGANSFAAAIKTKIFVRGEPAGEILLRWHPSQSFLSLAAGLLMYRFDRAYPWPQFLLDRFPRWFLPKPKHEPFALEWKKVNLLSKLKRPKPELRFFEHVIREMQIFNPEVDQLSAKGMITYYGDAKVNKTVFIFEIASEFPEALRCQQRIRSNFNPFTHDLSRIQGNITCDWLEAQGELQGSKQ